MPTLAHTRLDVVGSSFSDEALELLADGVSLDYLLAVMPDAVSVDRFLELLTARVTAWAFKNLEVNPDRGDSMSSSHIIRPQALRDLQPPRTKFWYSDSIQSWHHVVAQRNFSDELKALEKLLENRLKNTSLAKKLTWNSLTGIAVIAGDLFRLFPKYDSEQWIYEGHESLIELWNAFA
jgi:hypothetical protein